MAVLQGPGAGRVRLVIPSETVVGRLSSGGVVGIPFATLAAALGDSFLLAADAGQANGIATLDGTGKVPTGQLPAAVLGSVKFKGTWHAGTNTPTLPGTPAAGDYYVVSAPGSTSLSGINEWKAGDWAIYDGAAWGKVDNTDAVTSVAGRTGVVVLSDADVSGVEAISRKDANSGYAGLDAGGAVAKPVQELKAWNPPNTAGKMGLNAGTICFGDGAAVRKALHDGNVGQNNGVCGLDNNGKVPQGNLTGTLLPVAAVRKWGGTVSVPAQGTVDLGVMTRNANEMFTFCAFLQEAVGGLSWPGPGPSSDKVSIWLERTGNAGELKLRASNSHADTARTVEWLLLGVVS